MYNPLYDQDSVDGDIRYGSVGENRFALPKLRSILGYSWFCIKVELTNSSVAFCMPMSKKYCGMGLILPNNEADCKIC